MSFQGSYKKYVKKGVCFGKTYTNNSDQSFETKAAGRKCFEDEWGPFLGTRIVIFILFFPPFFEEKAYENTQQSFFAINLHGCDYWRRYRADGNRDE